MTEPAQPPSGPNGLPHWVVRWSMLSASFLFAWGVGVWLLRVGERTDDGGPVTCAILFGLAMWFNGLLIGLFGDFISPRIAAGQSLPAERRVRIGYGLYLAAISAVLGAVLGGAGGYLLRLIS